MDDKVVRLSGLPQAEQDHLIQAARAHEIYLLARLSSHDAISIAGVFADEAHKYAGHKRTPTTGYFHIQWQLAEQAIENGSADIHQWYAVDPVMGEQDALYGYFYLMEKPQTIAAKDIWCKQSDVDEFRLAPPQVSNQTKVSIPPPRQKSVTKAQILIAFGDFVKDMKLGKAMADGNTNWLSDCEVTRGTPGRGGAQSTWNPLLMAVALCERRLAKRADLARAFHAHSFLADWRDEWKEQEDQIT